MRFLLDHDVPERVGDVLVQAGHDVARLRAVLPVDAADRDVLRRAIDDDRILITCNRDDFLNLVHGGAHPGLLILIRRRSRIEECAALLRLIKKAGAHGLNGNVNFA